MRAIVTGSNGFIGYNLCRQLKQENHEVVGVDDLSAGLAGNAVDGFTYHTVKVQDQDAIRKIVGDFRPDAIFHLAAIPRVSYSVKEPFKTAEANILGTVSILEAVIKNDLVDVTRVVSTSSSSVYGGADVRPTPEDIGCDPKSPYALEKYQGEEWCRMFARLYGLDVCCMRYFNVFGPHSLFGGAYSTVLSAWLYHLYIDSAYTPFLEGDGTQSRDFCFVENVVQANIRAATCKTRLTGEAFNIAQGKATSLLEVKRLLEEITGKELSLEFRPDRVGDVKHTLADISRAREMLGYEPTTDFAEQVKVMAAWYKDSYPTGAIRK